MRLTWKNSEKSKLYFIDGEYKLYLICGDGAVEHHYPGDVSEMGLFKRRSRRIQIEHSVEIYLQNRDSYVCSPQGIPAVAINISKGGACVVVGKMVLDGEHLFFSAQRGGKNLLSLYGLTAENVSVQASAVWMDSCYYRDKTAFKMGVQFLEVQEKLFMEIEGASSVIDCGTE